MAQDIYKLEEDDVDFLQTHIIDQSYSHDELLKLLQLQGL
jgi:hypothetical protein